MSLAADWAQAVWETLALTGPWLLGGFFLAGLLHVVLPERWVHRHLGGDTGRSVMWGAVLGAPLPLCSCSVLPTAVGVSGLATRAITNRSLSLLWAISAMNFSGAPVAADT